MRTTTIAVDTGTFDILLKSKSDFEKIVGENLKWREFLTQVTLILEAYYKEPPILARRYNKYVYAADCPKCHKTNGPLHRSRAIIWRIKCECGMEYVAVP